MATPDLLTRLRGKGPDLLTRVRGELDARLRELRPLLAEYERLLVAASALDAESEASEDAPQRAQRGASSVAILAALEHGSHTASELVIVTAINGPVIQNNLRRLQQSGAITRTKRAGDGKAAYALASTPA
jgi:hypothetical protein